MSHFVLKKQKIRSGTVRFITGHLYLGIDHKEHGYEILSMPRDWNPSKEDAKTELHYFSPVDQRVLRSCHRICQPPLVLAAEDVKVKYRVESFRQQLSCENLVRDFVRATQYYLKAQMARPFTLVQISGDSGDVELPKGVWVWLLGYYPKEKLLWDKAKAIVINTSGCRDLIEPEFLNISQSDLESRFPVTPDYWYSPDAPLDGFSPPSLR